MLLNVKRMTQSFLLVSLTLSQFANATLTPTLPKRGQSKTFFDIPNSGGRQEACIIPRFLPGVNYSKNSLEIMQELCSLNFYDTLQVGQKPALICQKDVSTNPGLNIFEVHPNVKENLDCTDVDEEKAKDLIEKGRFRCRQRYLGTNPPSGCVDPN